MSIAAGGEALCVLSDLIAELPEAVANHLARNGPALKVFPVGSIRQQHLDRVTYQRRQAAVSARGRANAAWRQRMESAIRGLRGDLLRAGRPAVETDRLIGDLERPLYAIMNVRLASGDVGMAFWVDADSGSKDVTVQAAMEQAVEVREWEAWRIVEPLGDQAWAALDLLRRTWESLYPNEVPKVRSKSKRGGRPRSKFTEADERLLQDCEASGLPAKEFAHARGLKLADVRGSLKRAREHRSRKSPG